jgi:hypothetical protein
VSAPAEPVLARVEAAIRDRRAATIDRLGADAVLWLAAPPLWTLGAAQAANFPASPVVDFLLRARDAGWCKVRGQLPAADLAPAPPSSDGEGGAVRPRRRRAAPGWIPDPELTFWMPDEVRREVIDILRDRVGPERLAADAAVVAGQVRRQAEQPGSAQSPGPLALEDELPGALLAWAALMASAGQPRERDWIATALVDRTQQAVAAGDFGQAQDLVAAGEAIAPVLAGTAEQALSRARRLLALGLRQRQDERTLGRYLDRPELSGAVDRLLDRTAFRAGEAPTGDAAPWALHLRGAGGVGKTMLIRYLASGRYAADRGLPPIPVARVDFDHIRPDYPVRRPVQLLLELADELALHTAANYPADRALAAFRARAARAHEAVSGLREAGGSPLRHPEAAQAVDSFGDTLAALGDMSGGVLLILDTCEELAKADLGNPAAPAVRATLAILERLYERAPSMRVLLAGRRPLPERDYLAVQPVAGFTLDEARAYLARQSLTVPAARPLTAELTGEIIRQSAAVDVPVPPPGQLPQRVSPFDLTLYAAWAEEDPDLTVAQVRQGSDAYVEGRIIERLADPLVIRALPALACAGRCRVATLATVLDCDPATLGLRLAEQEWIDADGDPPAHVMARPALAGRLRRYFAAEARRGQFAASSAALAAALRDRVRKAPLDGIDVDELLAALRLSEPADAAALWDSIAERATEPPGWWSTVGNMTRRILGEWQEDEWPTTPALRATVTAAHIAASRRDFPAFYAQGPWETVRGWAERHPDPESQRRLLVRAALGLLPYGPDDESLWAILEQDRVLAGIYRDRASPASRELAAAIVDAAHRLLESGRTDTAARLENRVPLSGYRIDGDVIWPSATIDVWARIWKLRLLVGGDRAAAVHDLLRDAELSAIIAGDEPAAPSWPDCIPPEDVVARLHLEHGLIAPDPLGVAGQWEFHAADYRDTIDGERLASLCLRIRLRHGVVDASVAERWEAADRYMPDRQPGCSAHNLVPPLFVSIAEAWLSAGHPDRALALLDRRRAEALGTRQDEATVRHADLAALRIIRRLRLTDQRALLNRLAADEATRPAAWRAMATAQGEVPTAPNPVIKPERLPGTWHAWWQSTSDRRGLLSIPAWPADSFAEDVPDIRADLEEMRRLGHRQLPEVQRTLVDWLAQPEVAPPARSAEPHSELRAAMRMGALTGQTFIAPPQVPRRLLAEMAFEEAELTELRLPQAAARLFAIAADAYAVTSDALGELLARVSLLRATPAGANAGAAQVAANTAFTRLRERNPALAATLTAPPDDSSPWRYWAAALQRALSSGKPTTADPVPAIPAPDRRRTAAGRLPVALVLAGLFGTGLGAFGAYAGLTGYASPSGTAPHAPDVFSGGWLWLWLVYIPLGLILILLGLLLWRGPHLRGMAYGQGVGASRLGVLEFSASVVPGDDPSAYGVALAVGLRSWRTAPLAAKARLLLLKPAVRLAGPGSSSRLAEYDGYYGTLRSSIPTWNPDPDAQEGDPRASLPSASRSWWHRGRGTALGLISADPSCPPDMPWERFLATRLSPDAAGRIEWIRLTGRPLGGFTTDSPTSILQAPAEWERVLRGHYDQDAGVAFIGLRHVIGRAVATSAGPVIDITGESSIAPAGGSPGRVQLLGPPELRQGHPGLVILQAEPAADAMVSTDPPEDHGERLALATALAEDGFPAVLVLPVLPAAVTSELAQVITAHVRRRPGGDAQVLLTRLRTVITRHVPPPVLDDIALFLSKNRYRG